MHVLRTLVVCLHLSLALAHVPVFPPATSSSDAFKLEAVTKKSYGVYGELGADDIVWLEIEGIKGEEMSLSLQRNEVEAVYDMAIWGEGLDNVTCGQKNWYGWTHALGGHYFTRNLTELPTEVKEAIGTSEAFVLHGDGKESPHFEPFGVGLYWPLSGCKDTFPSTATYKLALVNPAEKRAYFSLGVGMVESFSLTELLLMPFVIYQSFVWSGRSPEAVIGVFAITLCLSYAFKLISLQNRASVAAYALLTNNPRSTTITIAMHVVWVGASAFVASAVSFVFQMVFCLTIKPDLGSMVWLPLVVHIVLPFAFGLLVLFFYASRAPIWIVVGALAAGLYMLFFGWMSFLVFPALFVVAVIVQLALR